MNSRIIHGHCVNGKQSRTYNSWWGMMGRCYRSATHPTNNRYYAGISVCERWHKFINFLNDMGEVPDGKTLDRVDSQKNYSIENCRWATPTEQVRNRGAYRNNTSGIKGVSFRKDINKWWASITVAKRRINLGVFETLWEAAAARRKAEVTLWKCSAPTPREIASSLEIALKNEP